VSCCEERLCFEHAKVFKADLEDIGGVKHTPLIEDLDVTLTKQDAVRPFFGMTAGGSDEQPIIYNQSASEAGHELVRAVHRVSRWMVEHYTHLMFPCDTSVTGLAKWLLLLPNLVLEHPKATTMAMMIRGAVLSVHHVIDRPEERAYLGPCRGELRDEGVCKASLYAVEGEAFVRCRVCRTWWAVEELREYLLAIAGDQVVTARDAVGLINPNTGVEITQATIRGWKRRNKVKPVGSYKGADLFRVGDLLEALRVD